MYLCKVGHADSHNLVVTLCFCCAYCPLNTMFNYVEQSLVCRNSVEVPTVTEHRGQVVNTPAPYLRGCRLKSQAQRMPITTEVFHGFPQSLKANPRVVP
jgi:hypothetical protein